MHLTVLFDQVWERSFRSWQCYLLQYRQPIMQHQLDIVSVWEEPQRKIGPTCVGEGKEDRCNWH